MHALTKYREDNGNMSKQALAERLGVSRMTIFRWETGKRQIDEKQLPEVSSRLNIPERELRPDLAERMGVQ